MVLWNYWGEYIVVFILFSFVKRRWSLCFHKMFLFLKSEWWFSVWKQPFLRLSESRLLLDWQMQVQKEVRESRTIENSVLLLSLFLTHIMHIWFRYKRVAKKCMCFLLDKESFLCCLFLVHFDIMHIWFGYKRIAKKCMCFFLMKNLFPLLYISIKCRCAPEIRLYTRFERELFFWQYWVDNQFSI